MHNLHWGVFVFKQADVMPKWLSAQQPRIRMAWYGQNMTGLFTFDNQISNTDRRRELRILVSAQKTNLARMLLFIYVLVGLPWLNELKSAPSSTQRKDST